MPDWFKKAGGGARWVAHSSVRLALGWGLFGLAFIAVTRRFDLLSQEAAEIIGLGPVILLYVFMMGCVIVHGVYANIRFTERAIAWLRDRFGR